MRELSQNGHGVKQFFQKDKYSTNALYINNTFERYFFFLQLHSKCHSIIKEHENGLNVHRNNINRVCATFYTFQSFAPKL